MSHGRSWIGYDAACGPCVLLAVWSRTSLERRGFHLVPLQAPSMEARFGVSSNEIPDEMKLVTADGRVMGGARAVAEIGRHIWWLRPAAWLARWPAGRRILDRSYRWIAGHGGCGDGACLRKSGKDLAMAWLPLVMLPSAIICLRESMPSWVFMWVLAVAIYSGCKWLALQTARLPNPGSLRRRLLFLFGWPGMDASLFLNNDHRPNPPQIASWVWAMGKTLLGATITWSGVAMIPAGWPLTRGSAGMVGLVLLLHFGLFDLLSLFLQVLGVPAEPIMRNPIRSVSLAELWGRRWNAAFHQLVHRHVFRPAARLIPIQGAMWLVFLVSGLVHDLVISLPAGGGYGRPTGYFLVQALGVSIERSRVGRALGLGVGWRGRIFTMLVTLIPIGWLFHREFVLKVILPFLQVIGAT